MKKLHWVSALAAAGLLIGVPGTASAKITEEPVACETKGGQRPAGQQPECKGGGLEQETENRNPSGKAPPGQN
jgi:hypothetical protein